LEKSMRTYASLIVALIGSSHLAQADVILPDLPAGSTYQLVFVTKGTRDAFSQFMVAYNGFAQQSASASPSLPQASWKAIVSLGGSAQSNVDVFPNIPIYNTNGELVAANGSDFFSHSHLAPIGYDQFGDTTVGAVWTGFNANGSPNQYYLGPVQPAVGYGSSNASNASWATAGITMNNLESRHLYALSSPIQAVPEPLLGLKVAALCALAIYGSRRRFLRRHAKT
jgi:hypothetical protein